MDALKERFVSQLSTLRLKTHQTVAFLGKIQDLTRGRSRCPAARVAEPLRFRQICLAAPQFVFGVPALNALCPQCLVGPLELLNCSSQIVARASERFCGASLCGAQCPDKEGRHHKNDETRGLLGL